MNKSYYDSVNYDTISRLSELLQGFDRRIIRLEKLMEQLTEHNKHHECETKTEECYIPKLTSKFINNIHACVVQSIEHEKISHGNLDVNYIVEFIIKMTPKDIFDDCDIEDVKKEIHDHILELV